MFDIELNSFIVKFQQLRSAGRNAHLDLHCEGGQSFVSLRVQLGEAGQQPHHRHHQQVRRGLRRSPAYYRRQERRRAARQAAEAEDATPPEVETEESTKKAEEVTSAKEAAAEAISATKYVSEDRPFDIDSNYAHIGRYDYPIGTFEGIIIEAIASIEDIDKSNGSDFYHRRLKCRHCKCWCQEQYFYEHQCFDTRSWFWCEVKDRVHVGAAEATAICGL